MLANSRFRASRMLLLLTGFLFALPGSVLATRIDIDDVSVLGPLVLRRDLNHGPLEALINEVRYASGIYSYIYAVQTSPYFPDAFGSLEGEPSLVSFAVTGHPLGATWGRVRLTEPSWGDEFVQPVTNDVLSMTPIHDGFLVVPADRGAGSFTVVYVQSPRRPSGNGTLIYTARNYCYSKPVCFDENGNRVYVYDSFSRGNAVVPTPEPASFVLFGLGVGALAVMRRARRVHPTQRT